MPKMKYPASYSKRTVLYDDTVTSNSKDYYEAFSGYTAAVNDQNKFWDTVNTAKGVVPQQFMSSPIPMAEEVGRKGYKKKMKY